MYDLLVNLTFTASLEEILDRHKLDNQNHNHNPHLCRKNPVISILILLQPTFHPIMLIQDLLKFPSCFPDINKKLTDPLRKLVNVLLARSYHFLLLIDNVKLYCGLLWRLFLKTDRIHACFWELYLQEWVVVDVGSALLQDVGLFVVNYHVNFIYVWIHMKAEQHGIRCLIDFKLQTHKRLLYRQLHRCSQNNKNHNKLYLYHYLPIPLHTHY